MGFFDWLKALLPSDSPPQSNKKRRRDDDELALVESTVTPTWMDADFENRVKEYAVTDLVPDHLGEVRTQKEVLVDKTLQAVKDRLTKEINYWDFRALQLKDQELAGKVNARLNSGLARQRADDLTARLHKRTRELEEERQISPLPPVISGGGLIIPAGLLNRLKGVVDVQEVATFARDTARIEQLAMAAVIESERQLGFVPRDVSGKRIGYDIESSIPGTGRLRFIEVKGRAKGATTVTVTKNEILTAFNKPENFILALVEVDGEATSTKYVRQPFHREPDFGATSVNYNLQELLARAEEPW